LAERLFTTLLERADKQQTFAVEALAAIFPSLPLEHQLTTFKALLDQAIQIAATATRSLMSVTLPLRLPSNGYELCNKGSRQNASSENCRLYQARLTGVEHRDVDSQHSDRPRQEAGHHHAAWAIPAIRSRQKERQQHYQKHKDAIEHELTDHGKPPPNRDDFLTSSVIVHFLPYFNIG